MLQLTLLTEDFPSDEQIQKLDRDGLIIALLRYRSQLRDSEDLEEKGRLQQLIQKLDQRLGDPAETKRIIERVLLG